MKILIVSGIFPPDIGGPASYVPAIAGALTERGHAVEVVCASDEPVHDDSAYPYAVRRVRRGTTRWRRLPGPAALIARRAAGADLVYANGLNAAAAAGAALARRPLVCKVVSDFAWERAVSWGWYAGSMESFRTARGGLRLRLLRAYRSAPLRRAEALITPSAYLGATITGWGIDPARVHVVHNALEPVHPTREVALPPGDPVVLFVGRLTAVKRVDGILRALAELPCARLVVAGDGADRGELEALAATLGIAHRVLWLGAVPRSSIPSLCRQAALLVLNSSHEGLPHAAVEAMAEGTPVVATAVGGTPEVVEDGVTGLLVHPEEPGALRDAMARLLACPEQRRCMGAAARVRAQQHFGFAAMVERTERILAQVARTPAPAVLSEPLGRLHAG